MYCNSFKVDAADSVHLNWLVYAGCKWMRNEIFWEFQALVISQTTWNCILNLVWTSENSTGCLFGKLILVHLPFIRVACNPLGSRNICNPDMAMWSGFLFVLYIWAMNGYLWNKYWQPYLRKEKYVRQLNALPTANLKSLTLVSGMRCVDSVIMNNCFLLQALIQLNYLRFTVSFLV